MAFAEAPDLFPRAHMTICKLMYRKINQKKISSSREPDALFWPRLGLSLYLVHIHVFRQTHLYIKNKTKKNL